MLHLGEKDHISRAEKFSAPGLSDEIDPFGRAAGEDDFVRTGGAEVLGDASPRAFIRLGRARTELVQAPMDVGVLVLVIISQGLENLSRLLGGRRVVEIDKWMVVRPFPQDREVFPDRAPIPFRARNFVHVPNLPCESRRAIIFGKISAEKSQSRLPRTPFRGKPDIRFSMPDRAHTLAIDPELQPGARNAIRDCLRVKPEERITIITDEETREIAAALQAEVEEVGAEHSVFVLEEHAERPLTDMPSVVLEDLAQSHVSIFCAQTQRGELRSRR